MSVIKPTKFAIGDLVWLSYDEFKVYGMGLVIEKYDEPEGFESYKVFWFADNEPNNEYATDIQLVTLPKSPK